jgi:ribosomal protein L16 Arg81 hydroxylase
MTLTTNRVETEATHRPMTFEWQRWAAATLLSGSSVEEVAARMAAEGLDAAEALEVCRAITASPAFAAGQWSQQRLRKLESQLDVRRQLADLAPAPSTPEVRRDLSAEEFLHSYYATNTPVRLDGLADSWPALSRWSPSYFSDLLGEQSVEVMAGRDSDPDYERQAGTHRTRMPLRSFVDKIQQASNDLYLTANNHLLKSPGAARLWDDFAVDDRYLDPDRTEGLVFLWLGPQGTLTPLHHDVQNVLFVQVFGRKRFHLISPLETHCVANSVGVFSDVDLLRPDPVRHPRFASTHAMRFDVGPGEALFIPVGWWHHVESLDVSASLSFTNFRHPNSFTWAQPDISY